MKLSSISLIVAALAAIAAIANAVPVNSKTHKGGETRRRDAKECSKVPCPTEKQARFSRGHHTGVMGHKEAKKPKKSKKSKKANKANEALPTKSSAEMALPQSENHKKELDKELHEKAAKDHNDSILLSKEAAVKSELAALPDAEYHHDAVETHMKHRDGHEKSLTSGGDYPLLSTNICDPTNRRAKKDIEEANQILRISGHSKKGQ